MKVLDGFSMAMVAPNSSNPQLRDLYPSDHMPCTMTFIYTCMISSSRTLHMLEKTSGLLEANLVSLTSAITACTHRWPLALHLLQQINVDVVAYNAAISVLSRVSPVPWIQALQLFQEMQERRMEANKKTYGALAKAFERGRG